ncbi:MAG: hypothetical protein HGA80_07175 [Candidatus Omnitrophica bacterium]|nr:hypothetical protein [Candidatus Omnitrophota bacterium]
MTNEKHAHVNACISDEDLTIWQAGLASQEQSARIEGHLRQCVSCRELLNILEEVSAEQDRSVLNKTPAAVAERARQLVQESFIEKMLDVIVRVADGLYQAAETTGNVLVAPWLPAGAVLRGSDNISPDALVVEGEKEGLCCRLEFCRQDGGRHTVSVALRDVAADKPINGVACVLYIDGREVESQVSQGGRAVFEDLLPGNYRLELWQVPGRTPRALTFSLVTG